MKSKLSSAIEDHSIEKKINKKEKIFLIVFS